MADDSCSSASSLPDLEPVELAPQPDHVRPETSQHGGATDGPHILKLLTGDALHGQKEADPASIWDEEMRTASGLICVKSLWTNRKEVIRVQ